MTALANRAYVATGTTYENMDIGLLAMWDALNEATEKPELDIAGASTCDIGSMASRKLRITGSGWTITSLGTNYTGPILIRAAGSGTIAYNATTLLCAGNTNIAVVAGDAFVAWQKTTTSGTSNGWQVVRIANGSGALPVVDGGTGARTAVDAFTAIKQQGSSTATGVWESATDAEAQAGTDPTRCLTPDNLGATVLGMGQTWQDMTASRAASTVYTNSTGRTIALSVAISSTSAANTLRLTIGSAVITGSTAATAGHASYVTGVIPAGSTYSVSGTAGTISIVPAGWVELR